MIIKHNYPLSVEKVFAAFTKAESAKNFMFRTDSGQVVEAQLTPEAGGTFTFKEKRGDQIAGHYGTFVEFEKNEKISFVFAVQKDLDQSDYVELFFNQNSSGCEVKITHDINPDFIAYKEKITQGWTSLLHKLDLYLANQNLSQTSLITKDSLGQPLNEGDSVKTIKDLKVKGSSMVVKRGTVVKKIHLISGNDEEVDCKVDGVALSLETQWLVKV